MVLFHHLTKFDFRSTLPFGQRYHLFDVLLSIEEVIDVWITAANYRFIYYK